MLFSISLEASRRAAEPVAWGPPVLTPIFHRLGPCCLSKIAHGVIVTGEESWLQGRQIGTSQWVTRPCPSDPLTHIANFATCPPSVSTRPFQPSSPFRLSKIAHKRQLSREGQNHLGKTRPCPSRPAPLEGLAVASFPYQFRLRSEEMPGYRRRRRRNAWDQIKDQRTRLLPKQRGSLTASQ
jgi:hypothetical protein